jgi:trk system potassium uptake protein TrkA
VVNAQELYRGSAEALEIVAHRSRQSSEIVGRTLREIDLPQGVSVGAIVRGEGLDALVLMAEPDLLVMAEDHLILFILNKKIIPRIEQLFAVDVGFF